MPLVHWGVVNTAAWVAGLLQLLVVFYLLQQLFSHVPSEFTILSANDGFSEREVVPDFPLRLRSMNMTRFGTLGDIFRSSVTEAHCDCYDWSCSLHLRNAAVKRTSKNRFTIFAVNGSDRARLLHVLRTCRNGFPYCDTSQGSVFCAGMVYDLSGQLIKTEAQRNIDEHVLLTSRAMGFEFYHGLLFPRGLLLNLALRERAKTYICGNASCATLRQEVLLLNDFHRPDVQPVSRLVPEKKLVTEVAELLKFSPPGTMTVGTERLATWITIENRIFHPVGLLALRAAQHLERLSNCAERTSHTNTALFLRTKISVKPADKLFRSSLFDHLQKLWNVSSIAEEDDNRRAKKPFTEQVGNVACQPFVVADEGPSMTWMLFAAPNSTWLMLYEYRLGYDLPNLRLHLRSWLVRRNCRFVAYVYWEDPAFAVQTLLTELEKPFTVDVTVISSTGTERCHNVLTCGNRLDHTLLVEHRAMYENGGYP